MTDTASNRTQPIALIGAGGHARVVADAILRAGGTVAGFYDDNPSATLAPTCPDAPHLGPIESASTESRPLLVAIGTLSTRRAVLKRLTSQLFASAVHPSAIVAPSASVAPGAFVGPRAVLNPGASIGAHAIINSGAIIEHDGSIAENTHIGPGAILGGGTSVGPDTLVGTGAIVLPGIRIGPGCTIGAGAVVTTDLPDGCRAVGVPARAYA
ncbi:MAG: acetyltransferase [Phycisphaerales bacterium JB050]